MASHRSTKGASKARRDHINHEIRNMRALLPVRSEEQEGLSYLHSMAAICTYIRKSVLLQGESGNITHFTLQLLLLYCRYNTEFKNELQELKVKKLVVKSKSLTYFLKLWSQNLTFFLYIHKLNCGVKMNAI